MNLGPLMVGIEGPSLLPEEREQLAHPLIGGVILFQRNIESPVQTLALNQALHQLRKPALLLAVDQEGGRVRRLRDGFTELPAPGKLGALYDRDPKRALELAQAHAWLMASEVRAVGFDFSFAPVLDLDRGSDVIGDRALHSDPRAVTALGKRYLEGLNEAGMASIGKHFPGHGSVQADSHVELPVDERPLMEITRSDLVPFAELIQHGLTGIMASHVVYKEVDDACAGFSRIWLHDRLRDGLGFKGAIFSDDLCMAAVNEFGDVTARARSALEAGCDMAIVGQPRAVPELLDRLSSRDDPARQSRLLRLRGSGHTMLDQLHKTLSWRKADRQIKDLVAQV